jgi:hypothetical protein
MRRNVSFKEAELEMLEEMLRILPEIRNTSLDGLLYWTDDNARQIGWFDNADDGGPKGWRFYREYGGYAGS